eukprot:PhF_6_TR3357/c0_g1_i2/m.4768
MSYIPPHRREPQTRIKQRQGTPLRIATFNIYGHGHLCKNESKRCLEFEHRKESLITLLVSLEADVICLQEVFDYPTESPAPAGAWTQAHVLLEGMRARDEVRYRNTFLHVCGTHKKVHNEDGRIVIKPTKQYNVILSTLPPCVDTPPVDVDIGCGSVFKNNKVDPQAGQYEIRKASCIHVFVEERIPIVVIGTHFGIFNDDDSATDMAVRPVRMIEERVSANYPTCKDVFLAGDLNAKRFKPNTLVWDHLSQCYFPPLGVGRDDHVLCKRIPGQRTTHGDVFQVPVPLQVSDHPVVIGDFWFSEES